jgi:hypothetical protein
MAAAFENKTIAEIRELIINAFQEKFNKTFRLLPKCGIFSEVRILWRKYLVRGQVA